MKVDSHIHLWDERHTPQPWMSADHTAIARPFGPSDIMPLLERNGVDAVILVQGACLDSDTDYLVGEAARNDWIAALTAWVCLEDPDRAARRLDELASSPKLRAVRHLSHNEPDHWLTRPAVLESIAIVEERDLILEIPVVFPRHFDDVVTLAERFPDLRIVIDHLGKPPIGGPAMRRWEEDLRAAAYHENVFAKVSGLNTALDWPDWSADDLRPSVEIALDCFGPHRLMCGSDWPVALLNGGYDRVWQTTSEVLVALAPASASQLLGDTACRLYRLE
ncbi:MAG: amidohydrolase family protein [Solirubrobacteraceae bacterium]